MDSAFTSGILVWFGFPFFFVVCFFLFLFGFFSKIAVGNPFIMDLGKLTSSLRAPEF